jgi:hypothetical protein
MSFTNTVIVRVASFNRSIFDPNESPARNDEADDHPDSAPSESNSSDDSFDGNTHGYSEPCEGTTPGNRHLHDLTNGCRHRNGDDLAIYVRNDNSYGSILVETITTDIRSVLSRSDDYYFVANASVRNGGYYQAYPYLPDSSDSDEPPLLENVTSDVTECPYGPWFVSSQLPSWRGPSAEGSFCTQPQGNVAMTGGTSPPNFPIISPAPYTITSTITRSLHSACGRPLSTMSTIMLPGGITRSIETRIFVNDSVQRIHEHPTTNEIPQGLPTPDELEAGETSAMQLCNYDDELGDMEAGAMPREAPREHQATAQVTVRTGTVVTTESGSNGAMTSYSDGN